MGNEGGSYTVSLLSTGRGAKLFPLGLASQPFSAIVTAAYALRKMRGGEAVSWLKVLLVLAIN